MKIRLFCCFFLVLIGGCAVTPPSNLDNVCAIFYEKDDWYEDAKSATDNWGGSISAIMAFMYQESRFVHDARPPRGSFFMDFSRFSAI